MSTAQPDRRATAFLSSTSIDLPEHREKVRAACLELGIFPDGMESWPAQDEDAQTVCLAKVDQADLFIGIYAHRYGWIPPGETKSITELEYDRAVQRGIPRLLFLIDPSLPVSLLEDQIEEDWKRQALRDFKARIKTQRVIKTFRTPDQLRAEVLHALHAYDATPLSPSGRGAGGEGATVLELSHLPAAAPHFLGRQAELAALDAAWAEGGKTAVFQLIAPGGTGKTSLVNRWLDTLRADNWRGAEKVFGWSFYSQGAGDDRQASDDGFFAAAMTFFGLTLAPSAAAWDKGVALAQVLARQRCLLVLDGLEPLQYPPTDQALPGELKATGLKALLQTLARNGAQSLLLLTSRERLADVDGWLRNAEQPQAGVSLWDLGHLSEADGAQLLHQLGVQRAGQAAIADADAELKTVSAALKGHALTLSLVGSYLARAKGGDVRRWKELDFARANDKSLKGHAFHAIATYETWFAREGPSGARQLAALRLLGLFDRPALAALLKVLRAAPPISGITEALFQWKKVCFFFQKQVGPISDSDWEYTLSDLHRLGLAQFDAAAGSLDAHPLVREYFAHRLQTQQPEAWREGHRRLYQHLTTTTPQFPDTLDGLQPLYQAVGHGCKAGLVQQACDEVYHARILRGREAFSTHKLGAVGADLGAVACFFTEPWRRLSPDLSESAQAWLLNEAAFSLRALGRLSEALEPMRVGAELYVTRAEWKFAAIGYSNLSELQLTLGQITEAADSARQAVSHADRSGDAFQRMSKRTTLADALHQGGETEAAQTLFAEAEALQQQSQPQYPLLYSLPGFRYCDGLLGPVERAAWRCRGDHVRPKLAADKFAPTGQSRRSPEERSESGAPSPATAPGLGLTASSGLPGIPSSALVGPGADPQQEIASTLAPSTELLKQLHAAAQRATYAQKIAIENNWLLDIALDHLTLARCALYADLLQNQAPGQDAQDHSQAALSGLRASGNMDDVPRGLLTRALLYHALGRPDDALTDLDEADDIARRGGMQLHLADLALHRARLFADHDALKEARKLIEECGYGRRLPELQDAEHALQLSPPGTPSSSSAGTLSRAGARRSD